VSVLIEEGAGVGVRDREGKTALDIATEKGYVAITQLLKDRTEGRKPVCSISRSAVHIAAVNGSLEEVQRLVEDGMSLDCGDPFGRTALWGAAKNGHKSIITFLLQNGSCVNVPDCEGVTPLGIAAREGHDGVVRELLNHGAMVNITDAYFSTLFSAAVSKAVRGSDELMREIALCCTDRRIT